MSRQRATITGLGHHVPQRVLTNHDLEQMVDTSDEWIRTRTGICQRHVAAAGEATSDLAVAAARLALEDAGVAASDLDLVIVATATPDMLFPATACLVADRVGATRAGAFDLAAGCSGFVYALATASQFIESGVFRKILVVGAETLSRIVDWTDRNTCVLFGDGAGAVVLEPVTDGCGVLSFSLGADGSGGKFLCLPAGGSRLPATEVTVAAGQHTVKMAGNEVFKFAVKVISEATSRCLDLAGIAVNGVDLFIPHQANLRIIDAAARRLGIAGNRVYTNVDRYGNTSSASIPIALSEACSRGLLKPGHVVAMCGFGAGLTWGACAMRWTLSRAERRQPEPVADYDTAEPASHPAPAGNPS